jgi:hypothetical protein
LAWPKQDHTAGLRRFSSPHAALLPSLRSRGARLGSRFFQQTYYRCPMPGSNPPARSLSSLTVFWITRSAITQTIAGLARARIAWAWDAGSCKPRLAFEDDDDHRRRRLVHALGLAYCLILVAAGVWLANELNEMKRTQDCVLSGGGRGIPANAVARSD